MTPLCRNKFGNTPLHWAALSGRLDVLKFFISEKHCNPEFRGQFGRTPLQFSSEQGHLDMVKYLISEAKVDPYLFESPLQFALRNGHVATALYLISKGVNLDNPQIMLRSPIAPRSLVPLSPMVNICVVGNAGSGKSTLVKALQVVGTLLGWMFSVRGVDPKTAGVIPTEFFSKKLGKVTFYDFAGDEEYYAGHEALLEGSSCTAFLVVLNLNSSPEIFKSALYYWELLIANAVSAVGCHACIIAVGSHADQLDRRALFSKTAILSDIMENPSPFKVLPYITRVVVEIYSQA